MGVKNYKAETLPTGGEIVVWSELTVGDFGNSLVVAKNAANTQVQVSGEFDGAVVAFYGSNDKDAQNKNPTEGLFFTVRDALTKKPVRKTAVDVNSDKNGGSIIAEKPAFLSFVIEGGTEKTNLKICVF